MGGPFANAKWRYPKDSAVSFSGMHIHAPLISVMSTLAGINDLVRADDSDDYAGVDVATTNIEPTMRRREKVGEMGDAIFWHDKEHG